MTSTPTPRTQPPEVRREQLLDAAERVLLERGLTATTVAEVAEVAGVAKGTMYLHFASKADLLAGLRARYVERLTAAALGEVDGAGVQEMIRRLVAGLYDFSVGNGRLHHLLFHEAGFSENDVFESARERLTSQIRNAEARHEVHVEDPETTAIFILHGLHGVLVASLGERKPNRRRFLVTAAELCSNSLRTERP